MPPQSRGADLRTSTDALFFKAQSTGIGAALSGDKLPGHCLAATFNTQVTEHQAAGGTQPQVLWKAFSMAREVMLGVQVVYF